MVRKGYTPEQIINKLREAEILHNQGAAIAVVSKENRGKWLHLLLLAKRVWRDES